MTLALNADLEKPLVDNVLSYSRSLRLAALNIITSPHMRVSVDLKDIATRCLQAEEVSVDVTGVRERVVKIGRLGETLRDDDRDAVDLCIRWLLGASDRLLVDCSRHSYPFGSAIES